MPLKPSNKRILQRNGVELPAMTTVRLLDHEGTVTHGKITRVTLTLLYLHTAKGKIAVCRRKDGQPFGSKGLYAVHPDDVHAAQAVAISPPTRNDPRRTAGTPPHWNV